MSFGRALQVELAQDVAAVGLDRARREVEAFADLLVAQALADQGEDRALPVRKNLDERARVGPPRQRGGLEGLREVDPALRRSP